MDHRTRGQIRRTWKETMADTAARGDWQCVEPGCTRAYHSRQSMRRHYRSKHHPYQRPSDKEKREKQRMRTRRHREQLRAAKALVKMTQQREPFNLSDVFSRGFHGAEDPLVRIGKSTIPGAGRGVFACVDLNPGDLVTWMTGRPVTTVPHDVKAVQFTIQVDDHYFVGNRTLKKGDGLGSFVNKEQRSEQKRKNCEYEVMDDGCQTYIVLQVVRHVPAGSEIVTTYGRGYRVPRADNR